MIDTTYAGSIRYFWLRDEARVPFGCLAVVPTEAPYRTQRWTSVLLEELGELSKANLHEEDCGEEDGSREELVQLVAVGLRALRDW